MPVSVTLTPSDLKLADRIAKLRNQKEQEGIVSKLFSDHSDERAHYVGILGEIVVAKALGLTIDTTYRKGGDNGVDLVYNGLTVDVKTRLRRGYDMLFYRDWSDHRADIFVLVWVGEKARVATIAGWVWAGESIFLADEREYRSGKPRYALSPNYLREIEELKGVHWDQSLTERGPRRVWTG